MNGIIEFSHVSAGYGPGKENEILHDLTFCIPEGKSVCILGRNGSGKTTLLRVMAGLLPHTGEIRIGGKILQEMKRKEIASRVALMAQFSELYFSYTVYETVLLGRYAGSDSLFGTPSRKDRAAAMECLEKTGLLPMKDRQITELSGGQLQRVFLARTMAQDTPVMLLDEPANHLDLQYKKELIDYLKEWDAVPGHTSVGVFHDISLAISYADILIFLKEGRIAAQGETKELLRADLLKEVYGIDVASYMQELLKQWENI